MIIEQILSPGEKVKLLSSGNVFFAELERLIDEAKEEIHFQVYIFEPDETGSRIANALLRAALRGVKIFLLIDSFGSGKFPDKMQDQLEKAGVEIKRYGPFVKGGRFHIARRLHRKVIVFDRKTAIVAGLNISNNYSDAGGKKAWLDFAVVLDGNIVQKLHSICLQRWIKKPLRKMPFKKLVSDKRTSSSILRVRQNDWLRGLNEAFSSYRREIKNAKSSLFIVGGYFLPGGRVRKMLKRAIQRGVTIKVILADESDVAMQRNAVQYLYQWMLRNKIEIYEYLPSNVHGKVLIADQKMILIGSYDLNNLSTYTNIELNLDIAHEPLAVAFQNELEKIALTDCRRVTVEELYRRTNPWKRFKYWISYQTVKSFFVLTTWLAREDEDEYQ
ncbi:MAG: phosphatidylserine/phosphatidylglycerophosphate/cardiolipin synthase family protein [Bacteroidetes bacterium]|nr:phosphatidylserine/phosphatidylglycerophosphate/cardiolipin synthase family protein [Bacteroidota bacterium]